MLALVPRAVENEAVSRPDGSFGESAPPTSRRGRRTVLLTAAAVGVIGMATAGAVFAATANSPAPPLQPLATLSLSPVEPEPLPVPSERVLVDPAPEELGHASMDAATIDWIESLDTTVRDDPDFGSVAISEDHTTVTITWFGEPSAALRAQIRSTPEHLRVVVQAAAFRPAELQELVLEAMRPGLVPGVHVTSGGPENDGSGLQLGIAELPAGQTLGDVAEDLATAVDRTDVPFSIEVTGPVTAIAGSG